MGVNVAICCQVHLYTEGLCKLLESDEEINVLGTSVNNEFIEDLVDMGPDVIITDTASCKEVIGVMSGTKKKSVLLINDSNMNLDGDNLRSMITEGLGGLLPKDTNSNALRKAVKKLNDGELWIDRQTMRDVFSSAGKPERDIHLTKKETEILGCVCDGLSNKEIAKKMYISEQTVKSHCNHLFKKFGVTSRLKLAIQAPKCFPESLNLQ